MHPTLSLLRDLVSIDSVNPELVPGAAGEWEVGQRLVAELQRHRIDVETVEVAPRRHNVVGVVDSARPGPTLMLCGHIDTVGVDGMAAPFQPVERDGRLYGRGTQDMKSGVAAMVGVATDLAAAGGLPAGRLIVAAVVDEEHASAGADTLVRDWHADLAIVTEPTDLSIATAHKGFAWITVETIGRAAHGSRPEDGRDAIARMGRVLGRLETLDRTLQSRAPHALVGTPSLHASRISGGQELSIYPARCTLSAERRTVVGEPAGVALAEFEELLARLRDEDPKFEATVDLGFERPPYELATGHPSLEMFQAVAEQHGLSSKPTGMSFWTDAAILGQAGIPTLLFGPMGRGLHATEEYVELESVLTCQKVISGFADVFCGH